jgi:hypothetical protein
MGQRRHNMAKRTDDSWLPFQVINRMAPGMPRPAVLDINAYMTNRARVRRAMEVDQPISGNVQNPIHSARPPR